MPSQRRTNRLRIYVVTSKGQIGPVLIEDLQDLISEGTIDSSDQIRSGFGARLGSVDDILSGKVKIGSDAMTQRDDSRTNRYHARRTAQSLGGMPFLLGLSAALVVSLAMWGWWRWDRTQSEQTKPSAIDTNCEVRLSSADPTARGLATVHVAISPRSAQAQTIHLVLSGDQATMVPANGLVRIEAGQTGCDVTVGRSGYDPAPRKVHLSCIPVGEFASTDAGAIDLTLIDDHPPSIAWDIFSEPRPGTSSSSGWAEGGWSDPRLTFGTSPSTSDAVVHSIPVPHCFGQLSSKDQEWVNVTRQLSSTVSGGHLWWSFLAEGVPMADGTVPFASVSLCINGREQIGVSMGGLMTSGKWSLISIQAKEKVTMPMVHNLYWTRVVVRCDLGAEDASAYCWFDPQAGHEPSPVEATYMGSVPAFAINGVEIGAWSGATIHIADVRIGRAWSEVIPPP